MTESEILRQAILNLSKARVFFQNFLDMTEGGPTREVVQELVEKMEECMPSLDRLSPSSW